MNEIKPRISAQYSAFTALRLVPSATPRHVLVDLIATMPCIWGYAHIGKILAARGLPDHPLYRLGIETYAEASLQGRTEAMVDLLNRMVDGADPATHARLARHYLMCSRYKWMFFDKAWRKEQWPV